MDTDRFAAERFAAEFGQLYRQLYHLAVRRVADAREQLSAETTALLLHLAQAGPLSLSDMARHFDRALSTLSVKVAALEAEGLLARQRDDGDARRALIWLSPLGREKLDLALQVLDAQRLRDAALALSDERRQQLLRGLRELAAALASPSSLSSSHGHCQPMHSAPSFRPQFLNGEHDDPRL